MNRILIVLVAILAALQACSALTTFGKNKILNNYEKECVAETGVDKDLVAKQLQQADSNIDKILSEDDKMKLYFVCLYTKMGYIDAEGTVQKSALKSELNEDFTDATKVNFIVDRCAVQKNAVWKTVNELRKCLISERDAADNSDDDDN